MLITPFRAEDPYKAEDAPFIISILSIVSIGIKLKSTSP